MGLNSNVQPPLNWKRVQQFFKFLQKICLALENLPSVEPKRKASYYHLLNTCIDKHANKKCIFCDYRNPTIYTCSKFKLKKIVYSEW